jgi:hypothetical protein
MELVQIDGGLQRRLAEYLLEHRGRLPSALDPTLRGLLFTPISHFTSHSVREEGAARPLDQAS